METTNLKLGRYQLLGNSLTINLQGTLPETKNLGEFLMEKFEEVKNFLTSVAVRAWEKILFTGAEIVKKTRNRHQVILSFKTKCVPFEELKFTRIGYGTTDDLSKSLQNCTRPQAALVAANHAVEKKLPAVIAHYRDGKEDHVIKLINFNLYNNVNPGDAKFETFIKGTRCLLFKS